MVVLSGGDASALIKRTSCGGQFRGAAATVDETTKGDGQMFGKGVSAFSDAHALVQGTSCIGI